MPHEDGAAYHPVVATVSLSGTLVLDVTEKPGASVEGESGSEGEKGERKSWRIVQEPRSLLITTGEAYTETLHGIAEVTEDVGLDAKTVANWELLSEQGRKLIERNGGRNERTTRISLTYRDVKKVSTIGSKVFGKART
ncbi:Putative alpha-ketoglutarate-dependent dioxygenase alkB 6 [Septoria linicola]|uniref:Alpha-ketoglutarate-dependent dioxygenase alkB 6 n=1 Tax=Septoria linicola TaxID=215465 RepID=A0A9Q9AGI6_9PEZI|nr:putative alpha-ketoglutarate-dependent dioxygenase alkB 6 [Septoria linicola]USW48712.1 Putative alpha-ketoglutarate-dependent dioxygenase alkB 6 [Septoria linicola]